MPNVDGKQFGYGPKGKKAAKKYAKKHGLKVMHKDNPGYYAESKTEINTYERIYSLLIEEMSPAERRYRARVATKKAKAKRRGKSTTAAA